MADNFVHSDPSQLSEFGKLARPEFEGLLGLHNAMERKNGAVPAKYRELMAIAIAATTQCPHCLETHTAAAKRLGATREEVAEAIFVAASLRAAAAVTHGARALQQYEPGSAAEIQSSGV